MNAPVFAEGDTVRVRSMRGVFRIVKFNLVRGEVTLWGGVPGHAMARSVTSDRIVRARRGDQVPAR